MRHKENYKILGEYSKSLNFFIRKGLMNPESEYYTGSDNAPKPMYENVIDIIHKAGGLAFLAHPFEYRFENTLLKFVSFLLTLKHEIKIIIEKSVLNFIINLNLNILYL